MRAENGSVFAANSIGVMLQEEYGETIDFANAALFFERAMECNLPDGARNLAALYGEDKGVEEKTTQGRANVHAGT